jgi:hypothetical protein
MRIQTLIEPQNWSSPMERDLLMARGDQNQTNILCSYASTSHVLNAELL